MPNGIFPVPQFDSHPSQTAATRPGLAVGFRTWFRRNRLDEELAQGADPATSAELSMRAAQLRSAAERSRLANALVETVGDARRGEPVTIRSRPRRPDVRDCADDLLALALRLRDERPIGVRGAAMTARLLKDGANLRRRDGGPALQDEIRAARLALEATAPATQDLAIAA